jgi:hypothetical protein
MPKDANEIEMERQRSRMIGKGATHSEIHNPNKVSIFNMTGKTEHERQAALNNEWWAPKQKPAQSRPGGCFAASTPILTPSGWTTIDSLTPGEDVLSFCSDRNTLAQRSILRVKVTANKRIWKVETDVAQCPIRTTCGHPFLTNRGWLWTWRLREGDTLLSVNEDGRIVPNTVRWVARTNDIEQVYNLITSIDHTFVVRGAIVHNFAVFRSIRAFWAARVGSTPTPVPQMVSETA